MDQAGTDWFILRCAGRSTLVLAKTLAEDGFEVWTPARTQLIRVPRMNVRREVRLPLLPSFVFVKARHLHDLLELANMAEKPRRDPSGGRLSRPAHRDFSVFHAFGEIPMIPDSKLDPLRVSEQRAVPRKDQPRFDRGSRVRAHAGVFEGMRGKIERCRDGKALVIFDGGTKRWEIPAFFLSDDAAFNGAVSVAKAA